MADPKPKPGTREAMMAYLNRRGHSDSLCAYCGRSVRLGYYPIGESPGQSTAKIHRCCLNQLLEEYKVLITGSYVDLRQPPTSKPLIGGMTKTKRAKLRRKRWRQRQPKGRGIRHTATKADKATGGVLRAQGQIRRPGSHSATA